MDTYRKAFKADEEVLTPAFERNDLMVDRPVFILFGITTYSSYLFTGKRLQLLFQYNYGWTFRHLNRIKISPISEFRNYEHYLL